MRIIRKLVVFLAILTTTLSVYAQDFIVTLNRDTINCLITKIDSVSVEYQIIKNGIREKNTMQRRYVADFRIAENDENSDRPVNLTWSEPKYTQFRWSFAPGYARRMGKNPESSGSAQQLYKKLDNCFSWETEIQYYFNRKNGIALNINGVHSSASERNVHIPGYGTASKCEAKQQVIYVGPAWAVRHETDDFLLSGCISLGPIFYSESLMPDNKQMKGTAASLGMNCGIGGEAKLSPEWALGMKIGYTLGTASNVKVGGQTVKLDDPVSLSSFFIAAYFSFRSQ